MSDSRPDSRVSGPTIMSAGSRKIDGSASVPFRSALDVNIVLPKKSSTYRSGTTIARDEGACGE